MVAVHFSFNFWLWKMSGAMATPHENLKWRPWVGHYFELPKVWQVALIGYVFYISMRMWNHQNILGTPILPCSGLITPDYYDRNLYVCFGVPFVLFILI